MKVIFTLVLFYFCLSAYESQSENGIQIPKAHIQLKADSIGVKQGDSIVKNSININGKLNAVSITNYDSLARNLDLDDKNKKAANSIKINGDSNSVTINQNNKDGNVNIQQNGNGNQVNVLQSSSMK